jgi:hypothetical protein
MSAVLAIPVLYFSTTIGGVRRLGLGIAETPGDPKIKEKQWTSLAVDGYYSLLS